LYHVVSWLAMLLLIAAICVLNALRPDKLEYND